MSTELTQDTDGAIAHDIVIPIGATYAFTIQVNEDGAAKDLTDYTARMQIRRYRKSSTVLLELTTENYRLAINGDLGQIGLRVEAEDTAAITWSDGVYDLELIAPSGEVFRFMKGAVTTTGEVTR